MDPRDWARTGRQETGDLPLSQLPRLCACLESTAGAARVTLAGEMLPGRGPALIGEVRCTVTLRCQRCLEPFELTLQAPVRLVAVHDEAAGQRLPDDVAPLICAEEQEVAMAELIEDELLLALPDYPHHADGQCQPATVPAQPTAKRQPFAVLAALKSK
ncbi:MAG: 23S rRNA accumulation protein YceD [Immundisolibacter sp.]